MIILTLFYNALLCNTFEELAIFMGMLTILGGDLLEMVMFGAMRCEAFWMFCAGIVMISDGRSRLPMFKTLILALSPVLRVGAVEFAVGDLQEIIYLLQPRNRELKMF